MARESLDALENLPKEASRQVAIFDAGRIGSTNRGVEYTVVNGAVTWQDGKLTGATAGQVLRC